MFFQILVSIISVLFFVCLISFTSTTGRYLLEKIIPMTKEQKAIYLAAKNALNNNQYTLKDVFWVSTKNGSRYVSYEIIFNLPHGELLLDTLNNETLGIKTSEGFEACDELNSAHLVLMTRKFATNILKSRELKLEARKQDRVSMAKNKIVQV